MANSTFSQPKVEITGDVPNEVIVALIEYRDDRLGIMEVMNRLDKWRMSSKQVASKIVE